MEVLFIDDGMCHIGELGSRGGDLADMYGRTPVLVEMSEIKGWGGFDGVRAVYRYPGCAWSFVLPDLLCERSE